VNKRKTKVCLTCIGVGEDDKEKINQYHIQQKWQLMKKEEIHMFIKKKQ